MLLRSYSVIFLKRKLYMNYLFSFLTDNNDFQKILPTKILKFEKFNKHDDITNLYFELIITQI